MFSNRPESKFSWTRTSIPRNLQTYRYEPVQPYIFREFVRCFRPEYFLDIGANIGYYSLMIAADEICAQIFAYEPMPRTFDELSTNVQRNGFSETITRHQLAASCTEGSSTMDVVNETSGSNALTSTALHNTRINRNQQVTITTLDHMHEFSGSRIALKVDVEGHELQVLQGATNLLANNSTILQIEILDRSENSAEVKSLLDSLGYKQIFSAGPDKYFSNDDGVEQALMDVVEQSLAVFIEDFKKPLYLKSKLLPGLGFELTPQLLKFIPSILRPNYRRKLK